MRTLQNKFFAFLFLPFLVFLFFVFPKSVFSAGIDCSDRYVTIVNPVRGRSLWLDKSLKPLTDQYKLISDNSFSATWLLQYDAIKDSELVSEIKKFGSQKEIGIFLEVSRDLASDSRVFYLEDKRWSDPAVVFLSGYSQNDRKSLIDKVFKSFKKEFGYYPRSVGAWWIDSYSLNYIKSKYNIQAVLTLADQQVTDSYGVWGQWWGYPYIPAKENVLRPAVNKKDGLGITAIQWAQRDPIKGYGGKGTYSLYSLQANDYVRVGKDINYFGGLASTYLDCKNNISQITMGLETGMESVEAFPEFQRQIFLIKGYSFAKTVTMSEFSKIFISKYPDNPESVLVGSKGTAWELTKNYRRNVFLGEEINYKKGISFSDYFVKDNQEFLQRYVSDLDNLEPTVWIYFWILLLIALFFIFSCKYSFFISLGISVFTVSVFFPILKSFEKFGWQVFFGPVTQNPALTQILTVVGVFIFFFVFLKFLKRRTNKEFFVLLPLSFAFDGLLKVLRFSFLNGKYYFGTFVAKTQFLGLELQKGNLIPKLTSIPFNTNTALSFLKIDFNQIWQKTYLWLIVYPLIHIAIAYLLSKLIPKLAKRTKIVIYGILIIFYLIFVYSLVKLEPGVVLPIT